MRKNLSYETRVPISKLSNENDASKSLFEDFGQIDQIMNDELFEEELSSLLPMYKTTPYHEEPPPDKVSIDLTVEHASQDNAVDPQHPEIKTHEDVVRDLESKVKRDERFLTVAKRATSFPRILKLWQRHASKSYHTNILRVHYSGENGIDPGAIALEFLERSIQEMGSAVFPDGTPIDSSFHVQSGYFRTCGEIAAVSLAQGGHPPCFLEQCGFDATFKAIDMMNITAEHLSSKELKLLNEVKSDWDGSVNCEVFVS